MHASVLPLGLEVVVAQPTTAKRRRENPQGVVCSASGTKGAQLNFRIKSASDVPSDYRESIPKAVKAAFHQLDNKQPSTITSAPKTSLSPDLFTSLHHTLETNSFALVLFPTTDGKRMHGERSCFLMESDGVWSKFFFWV